jgi:hypothetical protein
LLPVPGAEVGDCPGDHGGDCVDRGGQDHDRAEALDSMVDCRVGDPPQALRSLLTASLPPGTASAGADRADDPMRAAPRLFKEPFAVWLPANSSTGTAGRARRPAFAVIDVNYTLG